MSAILFAGMVGLLLGLRSGLIFKITFGLLILAGSAIDAIFFAPGNALLHIVLCIVVYNLGIVAGLVLNGLGVSEKITGLPAQQEPSRPTSRQ